MHQRLRRDREHDQRRHRQRPEGDRAAVDDHGEQHHGGHEERPLRRDLRARQQQIERRGDQRGRRGPFLDRMPRRQRRKQREQRAHREEHDAGDHGHVVAGDRQHMAEPRDEHRIVDRRRDRIAPAGEQGGCDRALVAVERGANPRVDGVAQALHEGGVAQRKAAGRRRLPGLDGAHHEAGGADALEIQVTAEIIGARALRPERRQQPRLQLNEAADIGRGALLHREPDPIELRHVARALHRNSRMSRVSTKPVSATENIGRASTV
ncbi:hypothetical protein ACVIHI_002777 [Bradyrhizobium sp. USDA 4524]